MQQAKALSHPKKGQSFQVELPNGDRKTVIAETDIVSSEVIVTDDGKAIDAHTGRVDLVRTTRLYKSKRKKKGGGENVPIWYVFCVTDQNAAPAPEFAYPVWRVDLGRYAEKLGHGGGSSLEDALELGVLRGLIWSDFEQAEPGGTPSPEERQRLLTFGAGSRYQRFIDDLGGNINAGMNLVTSENNISKYYGQPDSYNVPNAQTPITNPEGDRRVRVEISGGGRLVVAYTGRYSPPRLSQEGYVLENPYPDGTYPFSVTQSFTGIGENPPQVNNPSTLVLFSRNLIISPLNTSVTGIINVTNGLNSGTSGTTGEEEEILNFGYNDIVSEAALYASPDQRISLSYTFSSQPSFEFIYPRYVPQRNVKLEFWYGYLIANVSVRATLLETKEKINPGKRTFYVQKDDLPPIAIAEAPLLEPYQVWATPIEGKLKVSLKRGKIPNIGIDFYQRDWAETQIIETNGKIITKKEIYANPNELPLDPKDWQQNWTSSWEDYRGVFVRTGFPYDHFYLSAGTSPLGYLLQNPNLLNTPEEKLRNSAERYLGSTDHDIPIFYCQNPENEWYSNHGYQIHCAMASKVGGNLYYYFDLADLLDKDLQIRFQVANTTNYNDSILTALQSQNYKNGRLKICIIQNGAVLQLGEKKVELPKIQLPISDLKNVALLAIAAGS